MANLAIKMAGSRVKRIPREITGKVLLQAAKALRPHFTNNKGQFDWKAFRAEFGSIVSQSYQKGANRKETPGMETRVIQNDKGELVLDKWDTKKRGRVDPKLDRREAEAMSVQLQRIIEHHGAKTGDPSLLKDYNKWLTSREGLRQKAVKKFKEVTGWDVQYGHFLPIRGKGSQTPFGPVQTAGDWEPTNPWIDVTGDGDTLYNQGNTAKGDHPLAHFDPKDVELAGGGGSGLVAPHQLEDFVQFMIERNYGKDNPYLASTTTGTNLEEFTPGDLIKARDQRLSLQQVAADRDRLNQLAQQTRESVAASASESYKLQRPPGINIQTGLRGQQSYVGRTYELERQWMEKHGPGAGWNRMSRAIEGAVTGTAQVLLNATTEAVKSGVAKVSPIARGAIAAGEVSTGDYIGAASTLLGFEDVTYEQIPKNQLEAWGREVKRDVKVPSSLPSPRSLPSRVGRY